MRLLKSLASTPLHGGDPGLPAIFGGRTVEGDRAQRGRIAVQLGGTQAGSHDRLEVDGTATLGGVVVAVFEAGFRPEAGDAFDVLIADAIVDAGIRAPTGFRLGIVDAGGGRRALRLVATGGFLEPLPLRER